MNPTTQPNNQVAIANDEHMLGGIDQYWSTLATLSPAGNATTPAALKAVFQDDIDQTRKLTQLESQVAQQRAVQKAARKKAVQTRSDCRKYIIGTHGGTELATVLKDFGLKAPKTPAAPKVAVKASAQVKAKATRVARGTKGPKAKLAVKGVVPATTTEAPANAPAPAAPVPAAK